MPPLLPDAWDSLKRNRIEVLLYVGVQFSLIVAVNTAEYLLDSSGDAPRPWHSAYNFFSTLIHTFLFSGLMAVVFARLGEDIDRPLWRCPSGWEALQRFFVPWLIINLLVVTLLRLCDRALVAKQIDLAVLLTGLALTCSVMAIPVGACVMYHGRLRWQELGVILKPIAAQFELVIQVILLTSLQFALFILAMRFFPEPNAPNVWEEIKAQVLYWPIVTAPINLIDCLAFAMMWRILMIQRDEGVDDLDPYDF